MTLGVPVLVRVRVEQSSRCVEAYRIGQREAALIRPDTLVAARPDDPARARADAIDAIVPRLRQSSRSARRRSKRSLTRRWSRAQAKSSWQRALSQRMRVQQ